jgi:hypothetical protein
MSSDINKQDLVAIRAYAAEDKNFILATFLRGLYYGESIYSRMHKRTFMEKFHQVAETALNLPTIYIRVACLKDDPDVILGYAVLSRNNALHWVFVKKSWRGIGICKDLVPESTKTVTNLTKIGLIIANKKNLTFDPFVV